MKINFQNKRTPLIHFVDEKKCVIMLLDLKNCISLMLCKLSCYKLKHVKSVARRFFFLLFPFRKRHL